MEAAVHSPREKHSVHHFSFGRERKGSQDCELGHAAMGIPHLNVSKPIARNSRPLVQPDHPITEQICSGLAVAKLLSTMNCIVSVSFFLCILRDAFCSLPSGTLRAYDARRQIRPGPCFVEGVRYLCIGSGQIILRTILCK